MGLDLETDLETIKKTNRDNVPAYKTGQSEVMWPFLIDVRQCKVWGSQKFLM